MARKRNERKTRGDLARLKKLELFTSQEAARIGISRLSLYRLAEQGEILKVGPGLFRHPDLSLQGEALDYAVASRRLGDSSVIGGLTALFHYRLTDEAPRQIWVLVPPSMRPRATQYRCLRTSNSLKAEVEDYKVYRIVTLERALLEALKYSTKMGLEVALSCVRKALNQKLTRMGKLESAAKNLKLVPVLTKHWEAIIA